MKMSKPKRRTQTNYKTVARLFVRERSVFERSSVSAVRTVYSAREKAFSCGPGHFRFFWRVRNQDVGKIDTLNFRKGQKFFATVSPALRYWHLSRHCTMLS